MSPNRAKIIKAILTNNTLSEDKKSEIIAEIMDEFQKTYPDLQYHATKADVKESELKLTKEIENVKLEIEEVRKETKEIEAKLSREIKELDMKLSKEIKEVELKLTKEIENAKFIMLKWQFVFWISQMAAIIAIFYKLIH